MSCRRVQPQEYYDLKELKRQNLRLDRLVDYVKMQNEFRLKKYEKKSRLLRGFNNVTEELVRDFKPDAIAHIQSIKSALPEYGFLYNIVDDKHALSHVVYIKYDDFPLMENRNVSRNIQAIASQFFPKDTDHFDATCLYLLIFYALLVNRHANWITIDYVTNCNLDHHYALHVDWITKN